jgi:hypothetical protein
MLRQTMERIDRLLDGQTSDSEFNRQLENSRFLRECKAKGFKRLEGAGLVQQCYKTSQKRAYERREELARKTAHLVNDKLLSIHTIAKRLGAAAETLENYCHEFGFVLKNREERKAEAERRQRKEARDAERKQQAEDKATFDKVDQMLKQGKTLGLIISELDSSRYQIERVAKVHGYKLGGGKLTKV